MKTIANEDQLQREALMNENRNWKRHMMGQYRSGNYVKDFEGMFRTYTRYTKLADYISEVTGKTPKTDADGLPVLSNFEQFDSIKAIRSDKKTQLIGLDAEWVGEPRRILSWQMASIKDGYLIEMIIEPLKDKRLPLELALGTMLDCLNLPTIAKRDLKDKVDTVDVTLACHAGLGDISSLDDKERELLYQGTEVQGGFVTLQPMIRIVDSHKKEHVNNPRCYRVRLNVADSMCHSVADGKSLDSLGEVIGIPKIELSKETKAHMDVLKEEKAEKFAEYASRDSVITLLYLSALYGYNSRIPVTLNSAAANVAKNRIMQALNCQDEKDFARKYRGTEKVKNGMDFTSGKPHIKENEDYISDGAMLVDEIAAKAYMGGYNSSSEIGYYPYMTYDYDLRNAYPTAMRMIKAIDWHSPIKKDVSRKYLTLNDLEGPITHVFGLVKFEFPDNILYPTIPYKEDAVPVFLRKSDGLDGVYACGPEIYLALKLGAKVYCERGYVLNVQDIDLMADVVKKLVEDRNKAEEGSLEEKILKTMVNIIYGKAAQDVDPKNHWCARENLMANIGPSAITSPYIAAMTTSIVRAVLLAAQNEITEKGYKTYSVTTDGFISNLEPDLIETLDLYGFADPLKEARIYLSGDKTIWKKKHWQNDLLNITTRGNVSLSPEGVCAHNGYKTGLVPDSPEDRKTFVESVLERTGNLKYMHDEWTTRREMLTKKKDFAVTPKEKSANMDYDMKRKPVRESMEVVKIVVDKEYEVLNFTTEPFEDIAEFRRYREIKKKTKCLKTKKQLENFLIKAENPECHTHIHDPEFSKLMSAVMAHRSGQCTIPKLENPPLKDKLAFINSFNESTRDFDSNAWKECRKPERIAKMLPYEEYKDLLERMINNGLDD